MQVALALAALLFVNCVMFPALIRLVMGPSVAKFAQQNGGQIYYTQDN